MMIVKQGTVHTLPRVSRLSSPCQPHTAQWRRRHLDLRSRAAPAEEVPGPNGNSQGAGEEVQELPEALQGLKLTESGLLVDEKSGKVVNEMGATRWDVAVTALRGLLDPPAWVENTERTDGLILGSLVQFPTRHCFSVVGANEPGFVEDCVATVAKVCQAEVDATKDVKVVERLGGKYLSLQIDATVRAPEVVAAVMQALGKDPRVRMKY